MHKKSIYLVPGPTLVPTKISKIYQKQFGSAYLEKDFLKLYQETGHKLKSIMQTQSSMIMMTGEAMLGLWAGLKSCLQPGDKVLAISNGVFSSGIALMANSLGAKVQTIEFPFNQAANDFARIESAIKRYRPKMITAVHCETPSGILNPLATIGQLKKQYHIPLFYVDAVASIGGVEVKTDAWQIDICLGGAQKVLSTFPDMTFLSVSDNAWEIIDKTDYQGYDALKPFHNILQPSDFPYTPHWHGVAALNAASTFLLEEGLDKVYARHEKVACFCREEIIAMGLELFPQELSYAAPTVTAVLVPTRITWEKLDQKLRQAGLYLAGSYGSLANKVFRIGHMGNQAEQSLVEQGLKILKRVLGNC
jgi:aspartate aminotransferase-like enzyme